MIYLLFALPAFAANVTVETVGESIIVRDDVASARIQAESRAKWAAMEEAAQVKVSVSSVIHNAELLDESAKTEIKGSVVDFKVLDQGRDGDTYWVQAKVTVDPTKSQNAMGNFAMNTKIAIYMPLMLPDGTAEESHSFSEQLINDLIDRGFEVMDIAMEASPELSKQLATAAQKNDMATVRSLVSQFMAGTILVGKVKVIDKGQNVGYTKVNFKIVDGEVDYRIIGDKNGKKSILATGSMTGRGQGATLEAAAYNLAKSLANKSSSQVASNVAVKVLGANEKTIRVALVGNSSVHKMNEFRDMIKNLSWVLDVKEQGTGALTLSYPEKTLYLATIISSNGYKVKSFTETEIQVYP
jgi:hypothetical protein